MYNHDIRLIKIGIDSNLAVYEMNYITDFPANNIFVMYILKKKNYETNNRLS